MASLQHQRIITVFFIRLLLWHVCWLPPHGLNDPHGILTPQGIRHTTTQKEGAPGFICPLPDFRFPPQPHQRSKERAGIPTDSQLPSKQKWRRRRRGLSSPPPRASPTHPSLPHDFALSLNVQAPPRVSFLTLAPSVSRDRDPPHRGLGPIRPPPRLHLPNLLRPRRARRHLVLPAPPRSSHLLASTSTASSRQPLDCPPTVASWPTASGDVCPLRARGRVAGAFVRRLRHHQRAVVRHP